MNDTSTALVTTPTKREARLEAARRTAEDFAETLTLNEELYADNDRLREENKILAIENDAMKAQQSAWRAERDRFLSWIATVRTNLRNMKLAIGDAEQEIEGSAIESPAVPADFEEVMGRLASTVPTQ